MPRYENPLVLTPAQGAQLLLADADEQNNLLTSIEPENIEDLIKVLLAYLELGQKGFNFVAELLKVKEHSDKLTGIIISQSPDEQMYRLLITFLTILPFDAEAKLANLLLTNSAVAASIQGALLTNYEYNRHFLKRIIGGLCSTQAGAVLLNSWLNTPGHWLLAVDFIRIKELFSLADLFVPKMKIIEGINEQIANSALATILNDLNFLDKSCIQNIFFGLNFLKDERAFFETLSPPSLHPVVVDLLKNLRLDEKTFIRRNGGRGTPASRVWQNVSAYYLKTNNKLLANLDFFSQTHYDCRFTGQYHYRVASMDPSNAILTTEVDTKNIPDLAGFLFTLYRRKYELNNEKSTTYSNSNLYALISLLSQNRRAYKLAEVLLSTSKCNVITVFKHDKNEHIVAAILHLHKLTSLHPHIEDQQLPEQSLSIIDLLLTVHPAFSNDPADFFAALINIYSNNSEIFGAELVVHFLSSPGDRVKSNVLNQIIANKLALRLEVFLQHITDLKNHLKKEDKNFGKIEKKIFPLDEKKEKFKSDYRKGVFVERLAKAVAEEASRVYAGYSDEEKLEETYCCCVIFNESRRLALLQPERLTTPESLVAALEYIMAMGYEGSAEHVSQLLQNNGVMQRCFFESKEIELKDFALIVDTALMFIGEKKTNELIVRFLEKNQINAFWLSGLPTPSTDEARRVYSDNVENISQLPKLFPMAKLDVFNKLLEKHPWLTTILKLFNAVEEFAVEKFMSDIINADQFLVLYRWVIYQKERPEITKKVERMRYLCREERHQDEFRSLQASLNLQSLANHPNPSQPLLPASEIMHPGVTMLSAPRYALPLTSRPNPFQPLVASTWKQCTPALPLGTFYRWPAALTPSNPCCQHLK